ncbi:MAG: ATP phosphoribosyltransferase regulatory subunit [Deltaproteobacteria bacterium]|nr:ATP phosphoribosyltransferase regulatory subunit [Deltaproteobacteria bacterium]
MTNTGKNQAISLPQGVRDILPEEAEKIAKAEAAITAVFRRFKYGRVITPLLEYVDVLSLGIGEQLRNDLLKFIDAQSGRVMAIRPDITPQIARVVATRMKDCPLPLRLYYNENVIRSSNNGGSAKAREVLQIGAELISAEATPEMDAEMVVMAAEAMKKSGIKKFTIDLGDVGFVKKALLRLDISLEEKLVIKEAIAKKDSSTLENTLELLKTKPSPKNKKLFMALPTLYGGADAVKNALSLVKGMSELTESLEYVQSILAIVKKKGYKEYVTVDMGEVRGLDYYTGIIFEGFAANVGEPILSGGRYDTLTAKYGFPAKSTGFAFNMANLVTALDKK